MGSNIGPNGVVPLQSRPGVVQLPRSQKFEGGIFESRDDVFETTTRDPIALMKEMKLGTPGQGSKASAQDTEHTRQSVTFRNGLFVGIKGYPKQIVDTRACNHVVGEYTGAFIGSDSLTLYAGRNRQEINADGSTDFYIADPATSDRDIDPRYDHVHVNVDGTAYTKKNYDDPKQPVQLYQVDGKIGFINKNNDLVVMKPILPLDRYR